VADPKAIELLLLRLRVSKMAEWSAMVMMSAFGIFAFGLHHHRKYPSSADSG
jgi:hypothetical protein